MTGPSEHSVKPTLPHRSLLRSAALIPLFAFVGLGADSLSSSSYGPEEAFIALQGHPSLILFVAALTVITIGVVSASYCQIIEMFPRGGGGYVVASKLLSPKLGLLSGCALLVDYILTITISVASGVDAFYSVIPEGHHHFKIEVKVIVIILMTLLNLRGIKESIFPWVPVFILFITTHAFAFLWALFFHMNAVPEMIGHTLVESSSIINASGIGAFLFIILNAYSMGSGTYTGIEAVSNGMSLIKEPKVINAKRTMVYISLSLALTVIGLVVSYLLYHVSHQTGQTLNAVLFNKIGEEIGSPWGRLFATVTLFSETALLFVAAETGFLGGPQVISNMSRDHWFPHSFMSLSDHFVMHHGVLVMGTAAALVMMYTVGSVSTLVILYSLSVFVTFTLSQLGMVLHWWNERNKNHKWGRKFLINGFGFLLTFSILISLSIIKFSHGAWLTMIFVGALFFTGICIKRYYGYFFAQLSACTRPIPSRSELKQAPDAPVGTHTAVLMVGGAQGLSRHAIAKVLQNFGQSIGNFVFLQVGLIDSGVFKGESEIEALEHRIEREINHLVNLMQEKGYRSEARTSIGVDVGDEIEKLAIVVLKDYPEAIFFGGQLVLPKENMISRWLHNQTLFVIQRRLYHLGCTFIILPIYIKAEDIKTTDTISAIWHAKSTII